MWPRVILKLLRPDQEGDGRPPTTFRARFTRFGATSTITGFTLARSSIGFRYIPVALSGASTIRSGGPSAITRPPFTPPPGPKVDHPIRGLDDVEIVLDHDHGVAGVDQVVEHLEELADVLEVEAGGGLVEDVAVYQSPPAALIAFNSAFLLDVRRLPLLRDGCGLPRAARRSARRGPSSAMSITGSAPSALDIFDAEIIAAFLANPSFKIGEIGIGMKGQ